MSQEHQQVSYASAGRNVLVVKIKAKGLPDSKQPAAEGSVSSLLGKIKTKKMAEKAAESLKADSYLAINVNQKHFAQTPIVSHEANPTYPIDIEFDCSNPEDLITINVMDYHKSKENVAIGVVSMKMSDLIAKAGEIYTTPVQGQARASGNGELECHVQKRIATGVVILNLAADNLPRLDISGGGDPYLKISITTDASALRVLPTDDVLAVTVTRNTLSPWWPRLQLPLYKLVSGLFIRFTIFDRDNYSDDDISGVVILPVDQVLALADSDLDFAERTQTAGLASTPAHQLVMNNTKSFLVIQSLICKPSRAQSSTM